MPSYMRIAATLLTVALLAIHAQPTTAAVAAADVYDALNKLYSKEPTANMISGKAVGILVFPKIVKAGLMIGGQHGEGALLKGGKIVGHYASTAGSYGLQAGVQSFGYVLFLMNDKAIQYLDKSDGWELGVGPSFVVVDSGKAKTMTTTTLRDDVYAFIFGQKGLMAGMGLQGSKITKLD
jgi:lipid-binding SYLF domain-containing protein